MSYGCVQIDIGFETRIGEEINLIQNAIPDELLHRKAFEDNLHVTVRYGLEVDYSPAVVNYLARIEPFYLSFGDPLLFEPTEHSDGAYVLAMRANSPLLAEMHDALGNEVSHFKTPDFPYNPHITIAYVNSPAVLIDTVLKGRLSEAYGLRHEVTSIAIYHKDDVAKTIVKLRRRPYADTKA